MKAPFRTAALTIALLGLSTAIHGPALAWTRWGTPGAGAGEMRSPVGIAVAGDLVYVADYDNDRIQVFTRAGEALRAWGVTGSDPGQLRGPAGVAIGPDGTIFVTDQLNHRIQRFTPEGTLVASWSAGAEDAAPFGIAVGGGRVFVTDLDAGRVGVWTADGAALATFGTRGRGPAELDEPWGIAVDMRGDVFVADHGNDRVTRFGPDGTWLGEWSGPELAGPMGLALGAGGSLVVTDLAGAALQRFSPGGTLVAMPSGPGAAGELAATGVALDAAGDLFLADPLRQQVTRVRGAEVMGPAAVSGAFAMMPIAQPLGRGPIALEFTIPGPGTIGAEIFSIDGRRVHTVPAAACDAGTTRIAWDAATDEGHRAPVGVYFVRVHFDDGQRLITRSGRIVVLR
jgi:streptogramin lyase